MLNRYLAGAAIFLSLSVAALCEERVVDKDHGFSIKPDDGWKQVATPGNMPYCAMKLQRDTRTKLYIDLFDQERPGETLDEYVQGMKNFIVKEMNGEVISESPATVSGLPARKLMYSGKSKGFTDIDNKYFRVIVQVPSGKFYIVHGVVDLDGHHLSEIENMAETFQLGNP